MQRTTSSATSAWRTPEGFRKARRLMLQAEKFRLPLFTFLDIPGASPFLADEERGQAWAIAENLLTMSRLRTPIIVTVNWRGRQWRGISAGDRRPRAHASIQHVFGSFTGGSSFDSLERRKIRTGSGRFLEALCPRSCRTRHHPPGRSRTNRRCTRGPAHRGAGTEDYPLGRARRAARASAKHTGRAPLQLLSLPRRCGPVGDSVAFNRPFVVSFSTEFPNCDHCYLSCSQGSASRAMSTHLQLPSKISRNSGNTLAQNPHSYRQRLHTNAPGWHHRTPTHPAIL